MSAKYIIALDQGTTSSRTALFNKDGQLLDLAHKEFEQIFPKPGWVEHRPYEILKTQLETLAEIIRKNKISACEITAIGITNQRETTVIWDKNTGEAIYNAIVWQDRRTAPICQEIKNAGLENYVKEATGLV
ncbi:MAG: FGGY family carbohydrate kinase, partial [Pyrinomonadaceae bacterium]